MATPRPKDRQPALATDMSRKIAASPATVWSIITNPVRFSAWMEGEIAFDLARTARSAPSSPTTGS